MPTIQTKDLTGRALDFAVAKAIGFHVEWIEHGKEFGQIDPQDPIAYTPLPAYSTNHGHGGPLIDQFNITVIRADDDYERDADGFTTEVRIPQWFAQCDQWTGHSTTTSYEGEHMEPTFMITEDGGYYGTTSLIAAMRALVAFKLGPTVDIPQDLLTNQGAS